MNIAGAAANTRAKPWKLIQELRRKMATTTHQHHQGYKKLLHALETFSQPASLSVMQFKPCMQENLTKHEQHKIKTARQDNSSWRLPRFCHESVHHQDILLGDF